MSHFTEMKCDFTQKNQAQLVAALESVFGVGHVEVHEEGAGLMGYGGDNRAKKPVNSSDYAPPCHIIIRRKYVGGASNDVGYCRTEDGGFVAYISDYDKGTNFNSTKQGKVAQEYATQVSEKQLKAKGYTVKRTMIDGGKIKLIATKYSY